MLLASAAALFSTGLVHAPRNAHAARDKDTTTFQGTISVTEPCFNTTYTVVGTTTLTTAYVGSDIRVTEKFSARMFLGPIPAWLTVDIHGVGVFSSPQGTYSIPVAGFYTLAYEERPGQGLYADWASFGTDNVSVDFNQNPTGDSFGHLDFSGCIK